MNLFFNALYFYESESLPNAYASSNIRSKNME